MIPLPGLVLPQIYWEETLIYMYGMYQVSQNGDAVICCKLTDFVGTVIMATPTNWILLIPKSVFGSIPHKLGSIRCTFQAQQLRTLRMLQWLLPAMGKLSILRNFTFHLEWLLLNQLFTVAH